MSQRKQIKRAILRDVKEFRDMIRYLENAVHTGKPEHLAMAGIFFDVLKMHVKEGDLSPKVIKGLLDNKINAIKEEMK